MRHVSYVHTKGDWMDRRFYKVVLRLLQYRMAQAIYACWHHGHRRLQNNRPEARFQWCSLNGERYHAGLAWRAPIRGQ